MGTRVNIEILQGTTYEDVIRYESSTLVYAPITSIPNAAPLVVTSPGHGMPAGWRCKIASVGGMTELNTATYKTATSVTNNTVTFNDINGISYRPYTSGGVLVFNAPVSLVGHTAELVVTSSPSSTDPLLELNTDNGGIVINTSNSTITISMSAIETAGITFRSGVYTLNLTNGSVVTNLAFGKFIVQTDPFC